LTLKSAISWDDNDLVTGRANLFHAYKVLQSNQLDEGDEISYLLTLKGKIRHKIGLDCIRLPVLLNVSTTHVPLTQNSIRKHESSAGQDKGLAE